MHCVREIARAMMKFKAFAAIGFMLATWLPALGQGNSTVIRVGAFPNVTHAQPMVGKANGWFEKAMGPKVKIEWKTFNAGPSAIEALFAGAIDMTYIGPNPTISGYVRSKGEALRVVAGAASGGAALVVRADSGIQKAVDFHRKKVASPQQGRRRASAADGESRPAHIVSEERARRRVGA
jgi:NitT/TauT family transport system substrate-binding protein